jgi:hypothetical protein
VSLVIDNRPALAGQPGVHALIIGVSAYPHLAGGTAPVADPWGMSQLTSTATTAQKIVDWLASALLPVPLATCRLLLSPSPAEAALAGTAAAATVDNLLVEADLWRQDASTNRDNVTLFYFAGHGIQRTKEDAVLCLQEFRKTPGPALRETVDLATIRAGMSPAPGRDDIARTQFYFVDACREQTVEQSKFEPLETSAVFDKDLAGEDDRASPIFYSSISNHPAMSVPGGQTLFSTALIDCLRGAGGDSLGEDAAGNSRWGVSVAGLNRALAMRIADLNRQHGADQTYTTGGQFADATICLLPGAPMVDVALLIDPVAACAVGQLTVVADGNVVTLNRPAPLAPHPLREQLPAGLYNVVLSFTPPSPPFVDRQKFQTARAPRAEWKVRVV